MNQSLYDIGGSYEELRIQSDVIYNAFMNKDTTELDKMISDIHKITSEKHPELSQRYKDMTERTIGDPIRIAKHAYLLFGLFMSPEYAKSLVVPTPKVNPVKFELFYKTELPKLCTNLQNGVFTSIQEFVENARTAYIVL